MEVLLSMASVKDLGEILRNKIVKVAVFVCREIQG